MWNAEPTIEAIQITNPHGLIDIDRFDKAFGVGILSGLPMCSTFGEAEQGKIAHL
jgi:hypothetical protein